MEARIILLIMLVFISLEFIIDKLLDYVNAKHYQDPVPPELKDLFDEKEYQKSQKYKKTNYRFHFIESSLSFLLLIYLLVNGFFGSLDHFVRSFTSNTILQSLLYFIILIIAATLLSLPFSYYKTFVIEQEFGFNKTTKKLFIADTLKSLLLGILFIIVIGGSILFIYEKTGKNFWWYAWLVMAGFSLIINLFYTSWILPLFNKLIPLEEEELKNKLKLLAGKVDYNLDKIYIIDGSKRSTKANAFFSGFGPKKKVVLYDTLIKDLTTDEITAVLAHEIGHYKKKHIIFNLLISWVTTGLFLFLFSLILENSEMAKAMGAEKPSFHIALIAFGLLFIPVSFLIGLITNYISRKFEYQADAYAKKNWNAEDLISGLKKLSKKSLSNLTPHPWYVFVHYSHPPLKERIKALKSVKNK